MIHKAALKRAMSYQLGRQLYAHHAGHDWVLNGFAAWRLDGLELADALALLPDAQWQLMSAGAIGRLLPGSTGLTVYPLPVLVDDDAYVARLFRGPDGPLVYDVRLLAPLCSAGKPTAIRLQEYDWTVAPCGAPLHAWAGRECVGIVMPMTRSDSVSLAWEQLELGA